MGVKIQEGAWKKFFDGLMFEPFIRALDDRGIGRKVFGNPLPAGPTGPGFSGPVGPKRNGLEVPKALRKGGPESDAFRTDGKPIRSRLDIAARNDLPACCQDRRPYLEI